jgi:dihydrofolate reductase
MDVEAAIPTLAAAGVIDPLLVLLVPVVLGSGVRHFAGEAEELRLRLRDSHRFYGGVTLLDYDVLPAEP